MINNSVNEVKIPSDWIEMINNSLSTVTISSHWIGMINNSPNEVINSIRLDWKDIHHIGNNLNYLQDNSLLLQAFSH